MKAFREIARYLVGGLFIFSGLIKINDPIGTAIKLEEYFQVFAQDFAPFFEQFVPAALFLAVFLSVLEVILGVAVLINHRMPIVSVTLIVLIIFFTCLTFYSAYFNKVTDCGCFGDAIKLTPWQSFYKDIVLFVLIIVIFFNFHNYKEFLSTRIQNIIMTLVTVGATAIALLAIWYLPFIDFRSYKIGNDLRVLMQPEEPAQYVYVMEKDGKTIEMETYPSEPGYKLIEAKLLNPDKAVAKISDFGVWNDDGEFTEEILTGTKLVFIFHDVTKANRKHIGQMKDLAVASGMTTWILTSSGYEDFEAFRHEEQLAMPYFYSDATVLKTMIRSNPGIMLFKDGVVLGKWHHNSVPNSAQVKDLVK
jgi:uncharacterized membrane protein YphA (DoxX/SURF4 family)